MSAWNGIYVNGTWKREAKNSGFAAKDCHRDLRIHCSPWSRVLQINRQELDSTRMPMSLLPIVVKAFPSQIARLNFSKVDLTLGLNFTFATLSSR